MIALNTNHMYDPKITKFDMKLVYNGFILDEAVLDMSTPEPMSENDKDQMGEKGQEGPKDPKTDAVETKSPKRNLSDIKKGA